MKNNKKNKLENTIILLEIIKEFFNNRDLKTRLILGSLDLEETKDRNYLKSHIKDLKNICEEALKELGEKG